jgi:hypothetical protein
MLPGLPLNPARLPSSGGHPLNIDHFRKSQLSRWR